MQVEIGKICNYLSCDFRLVEVNDDGYLLKPFGTGSQHLDNVLVPHHRKHHVKQGFYQSGSSRKSNG